MALHHRLVGRPTPALILAGLTAVVAASAGASEPAPLPIGSRRQLFVDRRLVDRLEGEARLVLHRPQPDEIVLRADQPWEGSPPLYATVFRDGDRYRLYYRVTAGAGGRIRIGLLDATGGPIAGRSLADGDLVYGDEHGRVVTWGGEPGLAELAGKPVRLEVELKDADLYAFTFE